MIHVIRFPPKPSVVFSYQKPFYNEPNYPSWSLSILGAVFEQLIAISYRVPGCKQKHRSDWGVHSKLCKRKPDALTTEQETSLAAVARLIKWTNVWSIAKDLQTWMRGTEFEFGMETRIWRERRDCCDATIHAANRSKVSCSFPLDTSLVRVQTLKNETAL